MWLLISDHVTNPRGPDKVAFLNFSFSVLHMSSINRLLHTKCCGRNW